MEIGSKPFDPGLKAEFHEINCRTQAATRWRIAAIRESRTGKRVAEKNGRVPI